MTRVLASVFRWFKTTSRSDDTPWPERATHSKMRIDALDEYLRGTSQSDVTPEVLLRVL